MVDFQAFNLILQYVCSIDCLLPVLQIFVVGPAGCGKSECIKTFGFSERERGKTIAVQTLFTKAVESEELMGYFHTKNG